MSNLTTKQLLFQACLQRVQARIEDLESTLVSIDEARNNEDKSSAGDKYETGREMMQQEADKYQLQLANLRQQLQLLERISPEHSSIRVELGSLVITDGGSYFIGPPVGRIDLGADRYFAISTEAPIGRLLLGRSTGDTIVFNQKRLKILSIS